MDSWRHAHPTDQLAGIRGKPTLGTGELDGQEQPKRLCISLLVHK